MLMDIESQAPTAVAATQMNSGAPVVLDNLTRTFGATRALDGFSLNIAPGEFVALLGPSEMCIRDSV